MTSIGFRIEPAGINWAIVQGSLDVPVLVATDKSVAPTSYDEASALAWFRDKTRQVIQTYSPEVAAIRFPESYMRSASQSSMYKRCRIEGTVIEAAHSCGLKVLTGALATISKNLGTKGAKKYLENDDLRGLDWSKYQKNSREAILVAVSALEA